MRAETMYISFTILSPILRIVLGIWQELNILVQSGWFIGKNELFPVLGQDQNSPCKFTYTVKAPLFRVVTFVKW